jgi:hypothetical protein
MYQFNNKKKKKNHAIYFATSNAYEKMPVRRAKFSILISEHLEHNSGFGTGKSVRARNWANPEYFPITYVNHSRTRHVTFSSVILVNRVVTGRGTRMGLFATGT